MSENDNIRPYIMPALREAPSSQLTVQRRPLPSSAPKRTASQMNEEGPSTPPKRIARRMPRGKKAAPKSRMKRDNVRKSPSPSPSISSPAAPTECAVATHFTMIPGHGCIYYAEDSPPLFVPSTMMHTHQAPVAHPCPCHQMQGMHMPSIGPPAHAHGVGLGWNENSWGYVPGFDVGDLSQMHGNLNFNHNG